MCYICHMDTTAKELLVQTLRRQGFSMTQTHGLIFELLWAQEPQSMHELYVRGQSRFDRASLYRTIHLFEETGIVQRVYVGWKYKLELTDVFSHHHHHLS